MSRLNLALLSIFRALSDPKNRVVCEYCHGGRLLTRFDGSTVECVECFGQGTVPKHDPPPMSAIGGGLGGQMQSEKES